MRIIRLPKMADNEKGVVMMMVLLIATITLSVTTTMLYMLLTSTKFSGMQNRFATSVEAANAGSEVVTEFIGYGNSASFKAEFASLGFVFGTTEDCVSQKLKESTASWAASCSKDLYIDPVVPASYDTYFELGDYQVYGKIVYTIKGNTGGGGAIRRFANTCVTDCGIGFGGQAVPFTYAIEVLARNRNTKSDTAKMSVLYQK